MTKLIGGPAFACLVVLVVAATAFATASSGFRGEQADVAGTATVSAAVPAHGRACTQFQALERVFPAASAIGFTVRAVRRSGGHSIYWPGTCQKRYWFASYGRRVGGTYAVEVALTPFNTHDQALAALTEPAYGPVERLDNGAVVRRGSDSHRPGPAGRYHAAMVSVYRNVFISSSSMVFDHLVSLSAQERLHRRIHAGVLALNSAASPLPGRIAFNRHVAGDIHKDPVFDTFIVNADGSNERNLTQGRGGFDPVWSPDGRRLAFVRAGGVWTMNGDGAERAEANAESRGQFPDLVSRRATDCVPDVARLWGEGSAGGHECERVGLADVGGGLSPISMA